MNDAVTNRASSAPVVAPVVPVPNWKHLAPRPDSWRRQCYIKDRNITVGQLISTIRANNESPAEAAANMDLPIEAIEEAIMYFEQNKELIQEEAAAEVRHLRDGGCQLEPSPLSR